MFTKKCLTFDVNICRLLSLKIATIKHQIYGFEYKNRYLRLLCC